jgi:hypothetical protein
VENLFDSLHTELVTSGVEGFRKAIGDDGQKVAGFQSKLT